jgi:4a-hydroxytetrahydrobiopterin dehydratase
MSGSRLKLSEQEVEARLAEAKEWSREDQWIVRKYRFPEFLTGIAFVNEVARIAEEQNHHPLMTIDYTLVTLRLTTWSSGGLTLLDFACAARFDKAYLPAFSNDSSQKLPELPS